MELTYDFLRGTIILGIFVVACVLFFIRWLKRSSDDPGILVGKWVLTLVIIGVMIAINRTDIPFGPILILPPAIVLAVIWAPNIGAFIAKPLTNAFDGGDDVAELRPFYSVAMAHRMKNRYPEAIAEIEKQLAKFPKDYQGQLMLATINAEDLNDMAAAEAAIEGLVEQDGHPPAQIASALNALADWHLRITRDAYSARVALDRITKLFPDTELAQTAAQRIARLGSGYVAPEKAEREVISISEPVEDIGLNPENSPAPPAEEGPAELANQYVAQLQQHPEDWETREKLALIYADHYQRLEMAVAELDRLVATPNQPDKHVVRWLNTIAEWKIKYADDNVGARQTLQRIAARFPGSAAATRALEEIVRLTGEAKAKKQSQGLSLGSYEKDIGLKP